MLFQPRNEKGNPNDPFMINPKGIKVQIPEAKVSEFLARGFTLVDRKWRPTPITAPPVTDIERNFPLPIEELKQEIAEVEDVLEVTEL